MWTLAAAIFTLHQRRTVLRGRAETKRLGAFMAKKSPTDIDKRIGEYIRIFRKAKGLTQTELATAIGVTFQQVQKYENGKNRIGPGRLSRVAEIVEVPVSRFFEDGATRGRRVRTAPLVVDLLSGSYAVQTLQAFSKISNANLRRTIFKLVERVAAQP